MAQKKAGAAICALMSTRPNDRRAFTCASTCTVDERLQPFQHYQRCRQNQNCQCEQYHRADRHLRKKLNQSSSWVTWGGPVKRSDRVGRTAAWPLVLHPGVASCLNYPPDRRWQRVQFFRSRGVQKIMGYSNGNL